MILQGFKFRIKRKSRMELSMIVAGKSFEEIHSKIEKWLETDEGKIVDRRTLVESGGACTDGMFFLTADLSETVFGQDLSQS